MKFFWLLFVYILATPRSKAQEQFDLNINACFTAVHASNLNLTLNQSFYNGYEWDYYTATPNVELGQYFSLKKMLFRIGIGYRKIQLPFKLIPYIPRSSYNNEIRYKMDVYNICLDTKVADVTNKFTLYSGFNFLFGYYSDYFSSKVEGEYNIANKALPIHYMLSIDFGRLVHPIWKTRVTYVFRKNFRSELKLNAEFGYGILHMVTVVGLYELNSSILATNMAWTRGSNFKLGLCYALSRKAN